MMPVSRMAGTNPAPMPWMGWGPLAPPDSTGDAAGSTATIRTVDLRSLKTSPTPVMVPPVPTPATTMSTSPSVSSQISSAVVARWMAGLAGFSNCWGTKKRRSPLASSSALAMAPGMPSGPGVRTSSAP